MKLYCVTGMHRSGTSLIARLASLAGLHLGDEDDLLPPAADNPKGFWESASVKAVNDQVLRRLGGSWIDPPAVMVPGWETWAVFNDLRQRAVEVVEQLGRGHDVIGWKDPRTSITLPFWATVHPVAGTVLAVRRPAAVAASLSRRNGIGPKQASDLWLRYTLGAMLADTDALVLPYHQVLKDPQAAVIALADHMKLGAPTSQALTAALEFADPDLDHWMSGAPLDPELQLAETIFDLLVDGDPVNMEAIARAIGERWNIVPGVRLVEAAERAVAIDEATAAAPLVHATKDHVELLSSEVESLKAAARRDADAAREAANQNRRLTSQVEKLTGRVGERDQAIENLRAAKVANQERLKHVNGELDRLRALADERMEALRNAQGSVGVNEGIAARARLELSKAQAATKQERAAAARANQQLHRLKNRRIVRLSLSVAQVGRPIFRGVRRVKKMAAVKRPGTSTSKEEGSRTVGTTRSALPGPASPKTETDRSERPPSIAAKRLPDVAQATIVIPVYNAIDELRICVESIFRNTAAEVPVLLINDASTDAGVALYLADLAQRANVEVLTNEHNLGFVGTVNRGLEATDTDVVILNSDTEVTPGWLRNLRFAAYSADDIGTATPLSDNAGAFAVPTPGTANPVPKHLERDDIGRLVSQSSLRRYPVTPTGHGFCLYAKREMLDDVGVFDIDAFPRGYGEENDLCMRAGASGWRHVVDDATLVFHAQGASFGDERDRLIKEARTIIDERHPHYTEHVRAFMRGEDMAAVRAHVATIFAADDPRPRPRRRVLYVIHSGSGGTPATNMDLMTSVADDIEPWLLTSDRRHVRLFRLGAGELEEVASVDIGHHATASEVSDAKYLGFVGHVLDVYSIELVHIRQLFKHTLDLPRIAAAFGIPVVMSFHDFYFICPTVNLLDDKGAWCSGVCTPGNGVCPAPRRTVPEGSPLHLKHSWVYDWRDQVRRVFDHVDAFVTTTAFSRNMYLSTYPELAHRPFDVIEHGRDLVQQSGINTVPEPGGVIRIAVPGNLAPHKGSALIRQLLELDTQRRLEFHFYGDVQPDDSDLGVLHGAYQRHELPELLRELSPHFIGLFSVWGETYSHTLTEAWSCGVPVLATHLGALGERLARHGGGWVVEPSDADAVLATIYAAADDGDEYRRQAAMATVVDLPDVVDMRNRYLARYAATWEDVRRRDELDELEEGGLTLDVVAVGSLGQWNASTYVRILQRLRHPETAGELASTMWGGPEGIRLFNSRRTGRRVVLVQRTAVPITDVERFLSRLADTGAALIVDLDDNLLEPFTGLSTTYVDYVPSLRRLVAAADVVTVSTEPLAAEVATFARRVELMPNHLDERLWFDSELPDPASQDETLRILYMGTATHAADLALVRPALEALNERGIPVQLSVIGGERPGTDQDWYRRLTPPRGTTQYPRFVRWLRRVAMDFDIAVAPLVDNEFNRHKSDLKFLEYAALGLPGVYSDVINYRGSVEPGMGILVDNDPTAWIAALEMLASDERLRLDIRETAHRHVRESRTLVAGGPLLLDLVRELST